MDSAAISFIDDTQTTPGIFIAMIGENWEVYFNGTLIRSEMYMDEAGRITTRRTLRDVYFPLYRPLITEGTNILTFRILGDPAYDLTGLYYTKPYYLDDYKIIEIRQHQFLPIILSGVFGFIGIFYFMLYLSIKNKKELFYLYFSIFSILLFVYTITRFDIISFMIPNSDATFRLEYLSLFLLGPMFCIFIGELGRHRVTVFSKWYLVSGILYLLRGNPNFLLQPIP